MPSLRTCESAPSVKPPSRPRRSVPASSRLRGSTPQPPWPHKGSPSLGDTASLLWASIRPCWVALWGSSWGLARLICSPLTLIWGSLGTCTKTCLASVEPAQSQPPPPRQRPPLLLPHLPQHRQPTALQEPWPRTCWDPVWPAWLPCCPQASRCPTASLWPASTLAPCSPAGCPGQLLPQVCPGPATSPSTPPPPPPAHAHLPLPPSLRGHGLRASGPPCWWTVGTLAAAAAQVMMVMSLRWEESDRFAVVGAI